MQVLLSVVLVMDGGAWYAQCLEYDIAAQGPTVADTLDRFSRCVVEQAAWDARDKLVPFSALKPAPEKFWKLFAEAHACTRPSFPINTGAVVPELRVMVLNVRVR